MTLVKKGPRQEQIDQAQAKLQQAQQSLAISKTRLSGFMFPVANMPEAIQLLTYLNPLRYFLVIVRGIFLKGVGADILWPQMLALLVMGCLTLWLAGLRFRKTLA